MIETNDPAIWRNFLPWPGPETHKHARGRLGVVSGRAHQTGAARLAARAGLRIGAGVVRILCPPDAVATIVSTVTAVMLTPFTSPEALGREVEEMDAVVAGPAAGLDEGTVANIQALALDDSSHPSKGRCDRNLDQDVTDPLEVKFPVLDSCSPDSIGNDHILVLPSSAHPTQPCSGVLEPSESPSHMPRPPLHMQRGSTASAALADVLTGNGVAYESRLHEKETRHRTVSSFLKL